MEHPRQKSGTGNMELVYLQKMMQQYNYGTDLYVRKKGMKPPLPIQATTPKLTIKPRMGVTQIQYQPTFAPRYIICRL